MNKSLSTLLLSCNLIAFSTATAALTVEQIVAAGTTVQKDEQQQLPPNPIALDPNWWNYYEETTDEQFGEKISKTEDFLETLLQQAPAEKKEEIEGFIQRILINLKALPSIRHTETHSYSAPPFLNSYTFEQLLESVSKKLDLSASLDEENKEIQLQQDRAKKVRKHINTLFSAYLAMKEPTISKQVIGLEIMSLRAALAITEQTVQNSKKRYNSLKSELEHTEEEIQKALNTLNLNENNPANLTKEIHAAQAAYKEAQALSLFSEMNAVGAPGDTPDTRSKSFYLSQKSVLDDAKEALAKMDLIFYQLKNHLIQLQTNRSISALDRQELEQQQEQIETLQEHIQEWEAKTQQEYERTLQLPALNLEQAPTLTKTLERLHRQRLQTVQETLKTLKELRTKAITNELLVEKFKDSLNYHDHQSLSWLYAILGWIDSCCEPLFNWLHTPLLNIGGIPITLLSLLRMFIIIGLTFYLSSLLRHLSKRLNQTQMHLTQASLFLIEKVVHYAILCIGFALALASVGLSLNNLALVLGALSVGIGFGLQTIVNNFLSSLIIMFSRTLKVGDIIELSDGSSGTVTAINIQNTVVHSGDGVDVILPNSSILGGKLTNWTLHDNFRRMHIPFSIPYGSDKEIVTQAVCEAAEKVPCTVRNSAYHSNPQVWIINFGENVIQCELIVWVNVYGYGHKGSMKSSYLWEIDEALRRYHIANLSPSVLSHSANNPSS